MPRNIYMCSMCQQPKKGHKCPGTPPVKVDEVFKRTFEESRKRLKAKFASCERLVAVPPPTPFVSTEQSQRERERMVEEAFGRMQEDERMHEDLCPTEYGVPCQSVDDESGGLPCFDDEAADAVSCLSAVVNDETQGAPVFDDVLTKEWWARVEL